MKNENTKNNEDRKKLIKNIMELIGKEPSTTTLHYIKWVFCVLVPNEDNTKLVFENDLEKTLPTLSLEKLTMLYNFLKYERGIRKEKLDNLLKKKLRLNN